MFSIFGFNFFMYRRHNKSNNYVLFRVGSEWVHNLNPICTQFSLKSR